MIYFEKVLVIGVIVAELDLESTSSVRLDESDNITLVSSVGELSLESDLLIDSLFN